MNDANHCPSPPPRRLGIPSGIALVVSSMVGTGIFSSTGFLIRDLGSPRLVLLAWFLGGVLAAAGALAYGRLAIAMPQNGGEYMILSRLFHPTIGVIAGWIAIVAGFSAPLAAAAAAFASYAASILPGSSALLAAGGAHHWQAMLTALGVIWVMTLLHLRGIGFGARLQVVVTLSQVLLLILFIGAGLLLGHPSKLFTEALPSASVATPAAFAHGLIYVSYSYSGYNAAVYVAGEMRQPHRALPIALLSATGLVALLYCLINVVYLISAPLERLSGSINIAAVSAEQLVGASAAHVLSATICLCLLGFMSAMTLTGPRVFLAMCIDLPRLSRLAPKRGDAAPVAATLMQSSLASLLVLTSSFDALLTFVGLMLSLVTLLALWGVFRLRRIAPSFAPSWLSAIAVVAAGSLLVWVIAATVAESPRTGGVALATLVCAIAATLWLK